MYLWPLGEFDYVLDDALNIALDYLYLSGQAEQFQEVQSTAATAIAVAWKGGVRHRIKLANIAIKAVERKRDRFWNTRNAADSGTSSKALRAMYDAVVRGTAAAVPTRRSGGGGTTNRRSIGSGRSSSPARS